ncbi:contractile injection system protein, VgrG/Pvc8 family [Paenibacillus sp. FSL W8-0186]|uniref:contractile injection system protein, VgrG/Pvc8 family n=1 Tax=Paenibacillus sp. FSL W8-0186 TaxID=2921709 RepID=UPI0030D243FF
MQAESTQAAAGYGQVRLVWPYRIQQISELRLERNVGEHARLWLTGIVPEEDKDRYIQEARSQDPIALEETDEQGKTKRTLFQGILDTIAVRVVRGIYYVELTAVSCSALMDVQARTRSYQNREMKCSELVESVLAAYPGSDFIDNAMSHQRIGQFTLQYKETDWQFLKRVASRFGAVVIAESAAASPKLWMGLPLGRLHPLPEDTPYTIQRDLSALEEARGDGAADLHPYDFTRYAVDLVNWYPLGDILAFAGQELVIFSAVTRFTGGELRHQYILSPERGIRQNKILNTPLAGASLEGKIIDVQKDQVRVHMDVDGKQAKEEASWLPYSSIYTAEGNSGFYCMPQQGDSVQVYFPSPREEEAIAMSSIRRGGQLSPKMEDPSVKYWGTNYGKEMKFGGSELTLTATEGSLFISLEDEAGVLIQSDSGIIMASKKDLELASEKEIKIEAETAIYLVCGDSSIVMDGDTDIQGTEIVLEGLQKCPVYVEDLEPEPEAPFVSEVEPPEKKKSFWEKALDVVQVGLDVAGLIPGLGEIADLVNAGIYLARGDYANAALSAAAAIPFAGWAATGAKFVKRGVEAFKTGQKLMKGVDRAVDAFQAVKKTASMAPNAMRQDLGKVWTSARKLGNNLGLGEQLGKIKNAMQRLSVSHPRLAHAVSTSASVSQHVAMQYTRSLAIEAAMEAGGRIEFIGDFIEQIGGDKMRAALTWVSIATNKGRGKGTTGLNRNLGFTSGGNGGFGKRGGSNGGTNNLIDERAKKAGLDLTPKSSPYTQLGSKTKKKLEDKVNNRTITKEEWKRLEWNKRLASRRDAGVKEFWQQEKRRIKMGEATTRNWSQEQREAILSNKVPTFGGKPITGHHAYSVSKYPHLANRGEIIYPATVREHFTRWHGNSYRRSLPGKPYNPSFPEEF